MRKRRRRRNGNELPDEPCGPATVIILPELRRDPIEQAFLTNSARAIGRPLADVIVLPVIRIER